MHESHYGIEMATFLLIRREENGGNMHKLIWGTDVFGQLSD